LLTALALGGALAALFSAEAAFADMDASAKA